MSDLTPFGFHQSHVLDTYKGTYAPMARAEVDEVAEEFAAAIDFAFNPADNDGSQESLLIGAMLAAAAWIEQQPCACTPEMVEDWDACGRCGALGRLGDRRLER
jgi:hypothetical protein